MRKPKWYTVEIRDASGLFHSFLKRPPGHSAWRKRALCEAYIAEATADPAWHGFRFEVKEIS